MNRVTEYYIGKPCTMNIGADGEDHWAVGRIVGTAEGSIQKFGAFSLPSIVEWTTPHGSTFESDFMNLFELTNNDKIRLKQFELEARDTENVNWYDGRLNDVSHEVLNLK
jgi:hypothetical protein